jgi:beta-glucosidase-like glycosyl hydrolase
MPFQSVFEPGAYRFAWRKRVKYKKAQAALQSKVIINDLIRNQWGYQGIITTDDLVMGPIYERRLYGCGPGTQCGRGFIARRL